MSAYTLALASAVFLGIYDLLKKSALRDNSVMAVLFGSVLTGAVCWLPLLGWELLATTAATPSRVAPTLLALSPADHLRVLGKSVLVASSWACAYKAIKHLPISIAAPVRATGPLWTVCAAVALLGERPSGWQSVGVGLILAALAAFSLVGSREGIRFQRDPWIGLMLLATLLASASALYDKHLLQTLRLPVTAVLAWFSIYLVPATLPLFLTWWIRDRKRSPFHFRWQVPLIGLTLLVTDFLYFSAVHQPDSMISLISPLRRTSVFVTVFAGVHLFREQNLVPKLACVAAIVVGAALLAF